MAKKCARTFSIVVEKGKKSILDVGHLLPVGIARFVPAAAPPSLHGTSAPRARCRPSIVKHIYKNTTC